MRHFFSYGPVDPSDHFCVARRELVNKCREYLIGNPEKGGRYFTMWAPRQSGKTWLMGQAATAIEIEWPGRFEIGSMSMQGVIFREDESEHGFLARVPQLIWEAFGIKLEAAPADWESLKALFACEGGLFSRPVILMIDELDCLPVPVIDRLVTLFRDLALKRDRYLLHGLVIRTDFFRKPENPLLSLIRAALPLLLPD